MKNPQQFITRSKWAEGCAILTIDSYLSLQCYWCMGLAPGGHVAYPAGARQPVGIKGNDEVLWGGYAIACCAPCWWQWWSGMWRCIGEAHVNRILDEVRADLGCAA